MAPLARVLTLLALAAASAHAQQLDWWQSSVFYQIYPRSYQDSDGDGVGDLKGISSRLEHLKDAGIGATWLSPIFKSPMADFGYDIADFYAVDPLFGSQDDFDALQARAKELGIKLILDFVPNHSSNESEWFRKSVRRVDPYTDYYVWHDGVVDAADPSKRNPPNNWVSNFRGSAWEWNEERGQFYLHQFGVGQPDLNYRSAALQEEMKNVLRFWLDKGVDGFRVDAVPYLFEVESLQDEPLSGDPNAQPGDANYLDHIYTQNLPETVDMVQQWRAVLDEYAARDGHTRLMMAEVYATLEQTMHYYGTQERPGAHFPFNFQLVSHLTNTSTAHDLRALIVEWEEAKPSFGWSNWVIGNHDNRRAASRFGPPLADALNMAVQLLPGAAVTYNGEELAMEDTFITWEQSVDPMALNAGPDRYLLFTRDPERTPFQWDDSSFAGFTSGNSTWLPVNPNYAQLNLRAQKAAQRSHYKVYKTLVDLRRFPAVATGRLDIQVLGDDVLAFSRSAEDEATVIAVINMGSKPETVDLTVLEAVDSLGALVATASVQSQHKYGDVVATDSLTVGAKEGVALIQFWPQKRVNPKAKGRKHRL